jgi:hypothetical protein
MAVSTPTAKAFTRLRDGILGVTVSLWPVHATSPAVVGRGCPPQWGIAEALPLVPHFTRGFQSAKSPLGLGSQVQTCRYQMPKRSARLRA